MNFHFPAVCVIFSTSTAAFSSSATYKRLPASLPPSIHTSTLFFTSDAFLGAMACTHSHDCSEHECAASWSLFKHIDLPRVRALNEAVEGSAKNVFRSWELRFDTSNGYLESNEDDPELLLFVPFTSDVKIKSISVIGADGGRSPSHMRAFLNREDIDFSTAASMNPVQEWELAENLQGTLEYQTRYAKFQSVASLILHFPENFGAETTGISFIGLQGEATQLKRDAIANVVYEALPNPAEHRVPAENNLPTVL